MHNEDGGAGQDTDEKPHGISRPRQRGIGRSLRPGTGVPGVLVADRGEGSLFLQSWRDGPSAHLSPADAIPLRRELAAAFGSRELAVHGDQNDAW